MRMSIKKSNGLFHHPRAHPPCPPVVLPPGPRWGRPAAQRRSPPPGVPQGTPWNQQAIGEGLLGIAEGFFLRGPTGSTARQLGDFGNERLIVIAPVQAVTLRGLEEMPRQPASFGKGARD
jgi:hypothetical protein